jgi:hypothetical protein
MRRDLVPSSALPLAYFGLAHLGLALGLLVLAVRPDVPGGYFYHPRMVALVHLVTIAWLSGSILGAFYVVAPLALRLAMPVRAGDWAAFAAFALGAAGMIAHFWIGEYPGMGWSAAMVTAAIAWVGIRAWRGLPGAVAPWGIKLHVALAFANILAAALFGIVIGVDRASGFIGLPPLPATFAHAHVAAIGWVAMMVVGLGYRLIPMFVPAAMPTGRSLAASALFIEAGLAVVVYALLAGSAWLPAGGLLVAAGLASFVVHIRRALAHRMPRPPALPARDWSTWQTHGAIVWLLIAVGLGMASAVGVPDAWRVPVAWWYGVAGLVGFLAQVVVGIQGRLVPMYAWYRAFAARGGDPPDRGAHTLPSAAFARVIFLLWTGGVPVLAWGLAAASRPAIALAAALLLGGVSAGAVYVAHMLRAASQSQSLQSWSHKTSTVGSNP